MRRISLVQNSETVGLAGFALIGLLVLSAAGLGARHLLSDRLHPERIAAGEPARGDLAPLHTEWIGPWEVVGRIRAEDDQAGATVDAIVRADTIYMLRNHGWIRITAGQTEGPYGGIGKGSPGWLQRATSLALNHDTLYVLDAGQYQVSRWSLAGMWLGNIELARSQPPAPMLLDKLSVDSAGNLFISAIVYGGLPSRMFGIWRVLRYYPNGKEAEVLFDQARDDPRGSPIAGPALAVSGAGRLSIVSASTYRLWTYDSDLKIVGTSERPRPPLWPMPTAERARYRNLLMRIPRDQRAQWELPEFVPPVRGIAPLSDGRFLVLLNAGTESLVAEVIDANGIPLGRLTDNAWVDAVFPVSDGLVRVTDELGATVIERARLWPQ